MFSGSYGKEDVTFLLQPLSNVTMVTKEEKEKLIASGGHYSDVVVSESVPSDLQHKIYKESLESLKEDLAVGVNSLAFNIAHDASFGDDIVLISLVRAGTPLGVLLKRAVERESSKAVHHYGVSIIRDRGIDAEAMKYILDKHKSAEIYFIDGWTGKGTITNSLKTSLEASDYWSGDIRLVVYSDPASTAWLSMTSQDLLLPFGILNSTVAGLISRTVYTNNGYHGVHMFPLEDYDLTNHFIETVDSIARNSKDFIPPLVNSNFNSTLSKAIVSMVKDLASVEDDNKIKPSIAECTRALLRRVPKTIFIQDEQDPDVSLILDLTKKQNVEVVVNPAIYPYKAVAVLI